MQYDTDKENTESKIEDFDKTILSTIGLVKKTDCDGNEIPNTNYDTKVREIENKKPNTRN